VRVPVLAMVMAMVAMRGVFAMSVRWRRVFLHTQLFVRIYAGCQRQPQ
jgi:hypothetical protein